ncbi:Sua5 family translation factor [Idiomarina xiamenensis 10-D-4]|uniref:Threonylcarbamoyl-AMP synthase n=2 Tax=Idiomarina xiamenensis TaxID=1207041 RepID=K2JIY3_9GAMM|nr:Sua5 family translation factor [Idiomarina xiamenensis 10-D-4]
MHDWQAAREAFATGLIAYPTEAVFGLGCDPREDVFLQQLLDLKQRPQEKGFILLAADYSQLLPFVDDNAIPQDKRFSVFSHWPGPVTLLLPARQSVSPLLRGQFDTIACRVTAYEPARELCRQLNSAIVSTSANRHQQPSLTSFEAVKTEFNDELAWVMDDAVAGASSPSTIINPLTGQVVR